MENKNQKPFKLWKGGGIIGRGDGPYNHHHHPHYNYIITYTLTLLLLMTTTVVLYNDTNTFVRGDDSVDIWLIPTGNYSSTNNTFYVEVWLNSTLPVASVYFQYFSLTRGNITTVDMNDSAYYFGSACFFDENYSIVNVSHTVTPVQVGNDSLAGVGNGLTGNFTVFNVTCDGVLLGGQLTASVHGVSIFNETGDPIGGVSIHNRSFMVTGPASGPDCPYAMLIHPENNSQNEPLDVTLTVLVYDTDTTQLSVNVSFFWGNNTTIDTLACKNNEEISTIVNGLSPGQQYWWYVTVTNATSGNYTTGNFTFTVSTGLVESASDYWGTWVILLLVVMMIILTLVFKSGLLAIFTGILSGILTVNYRVNIMNDASTFDGAILWLLVILTIFVFADMFIIFARGMQGRGP